MFDFRGFGAFARRAILPRRHAPYRLSPKRAAILAGFFPTFFLTELAARLGFLIDDLLFRPYRKESIERPLFVTGNPRSGTTFLQRLLALDHQTFTCMRLWEILFAPSITQRRVVRALRSLDRWLGSPVRTLVAKLDRGIWGENAAHKTGLLMTEEDQYFMVHSWSTVAVWQFSSIMMEDAHDFTYFDTAIPESQKDRIMAFYKRGIQRHLYAHRASGKMHTAPRHYLSKNPSACPKIDALYKAFPDAKIVYIVRNPLDMIPSMVSVLDYTWRSLGDPPQRYMCRDYVLDMARHWYTYPLERLARAPDDSYLIVRFNDLVGNAEATVRRIYDRFGYTMGADYAQALAAETAKARRYRSNHDYHMEDMGLSGSQIVREFADIFDRFHFDTRGFARRQPVAEFSLPMVVDAGATK